GRATTAARLAGIRWRARWLGRRCGCCSKRNWWSARRNWARISWRSCGRCSPVVKEVRGRGLWIGIELTIEARKYCEALKEEGVLCKETHSHIIRIAPPLVIQREEIDWAFERIRKVLE